MVRAIRSKPAHGGHHVLALRGPDRVGGIAIVRTHDRDPRIEDFLRHGLARLVTDAKGPAVDVDDKGERAFALGHA